ANLMTIFDDDVLALDVPEVVQGLLKSLQTRRIRGGRHGREIAQPPDLRGLLGIGRKAKHQQKPPQSNSRQSRTTSVPSMSRHHALLRQVPQASIADGVECTPRR